MLTPEKAAIVSTAMLMVLAMIFGYRGKRLGILGMLRAIMDTGRVSLDIILIGAAAGIMVGIMSISGLAFSMTDPAAGARGRQCIPAVAADRGARLRSRHRPADGERLHPHRDIACPGAGQARRHADGCAYVRHVQRHSVDDHAAGGLRGLCCRQYRAHRRLDHRLDRLRGRLEHIHPAVPVRADAQSADGRHLDRDRAQFQPRTLRHLAWHHGRRRLCAGSAGTRRPGALRARVACGGAAARNVRRRDLYQCRRNNGGSRTPRVRLDAPQAGQDAEVVATPY